MRKLILAVTLGGLILMGAQNASAEEESSLPTVDVQEVSGLLDEIQAQAMEDAIERSSGEGSQALVFQMNTRGSVLSRERVAVLLERVAAAKVPRRNLGRAIGIAPLRACGAVACCCRCDGNGTWYTHWQYGHSARCARRHF